MVGNRFADKYFTRMLLMKILIFFQMLSRRDEKLCEKEKGRRRNHFFKVFSLPSFISWRIQIPKRETLVKESKDNFEEGSALTDDFNNERFSFSKYTELLCKKSRKKFQNLIPRKDNWRSVRSSFETTKTASVDFTNLNKSILQIESQIIARKISEDSYM